MRGFLVFPLACVICLPALAREITLPSGKTVTHFETMHDDDAMVSRFRFTMAALQTNPDALSDGPARVADLGFLCELFAVIEADAAAPYPDAVVISVAASQTTFGDATPDVAQFFEAFVVDDGHCIWDEF